jgi:3-oxoacyl-[acyl-carrier-protein] synthase III
MTALAAVATYLPEKSVPIGPFLEDLGIGEQVELYRRYYGFAEIRQEPGGSMTDLMRAALSNMDELRGREHDVRYVVQASTIQLAAPYPSNALQAVRDEFGLAHASAFSVTQHACASGLLAVDVCGKLLAGDGDPDALALVLAGEKTFTGVAKLIPNSAVMGEGMAAVLLRADGERDRMLGYASRTYGEFDTAPYWPSELAEKFDQMYTPALAEVIQAAVDRAGLDVAGIALVLPHNVNRMSWFRLCREIGLPPDRVLLDNQPDLGHCFCADPFINYRTAREKGRLTPGDHYVMTSVGVGATFGAMVFRH